MKTFFISLSIALFLIGCTSEKSIQNKKFYVYGKYINQSDSTGKYEYIIFNKKKNKFSKYLFTLKSSVEFNAGDTLWITNKDPQSTSTPVTPAFIGPIRK